MNKIQCNYYASSHTASTRRKLTLLTTLVNTNKFVIIIRAMHWAYDIISCHEHKNMKRIKPSISIRTFPKNIFCVSYFPILNIPYTRISFSFSSPPDLYLVPILCAPTAPCTYPCCHYNIEIYCLCLYLSPDQDVPWGQGLLCILGGL